MPAMPAPHAAADHRLGFRTLDQELPPVSLPVSGRLPSWLAGTLLRTGPAKFEVGSRSYNHWFDGLAMLHRFAFADGSVRYANRFLDSRAYRAARDTGRMAYSEFATDPCRSLFRRFATSFRPPTFGDNANVAVARRGGEFLALTESPLPVVFDPRTLETLGVAPPAPGQMTTAHPHRAPRSGELVSYATHFGALTTYRVYAQGERSARSRVLAQLPVQLPAYMHSFAITEHHLVLVEFPFVVLPVTIPLSGRPLIANYRWKAGRGTRFRVLDLDTGEVCGTGHGEPFFAFHHVNAYERGSEIILDLCAYDNADIVAALCLDRLRTAGLNLPEPRLRRYRLRRSGGEVTREPFPAVTLELPRIDYDRCNGRPYRYAYGTGSRGDGGFPDRITKVDVEDGTSAEWSQPGSYPGEPVFVRAPGAQREDAGVLLSVVLDAAADTSFLLALDAADLSEIARAGLPHRIPFGFHGSYFPGALS
jgi:beta,beta-carotene 9',10'-dioxygenase